MHRIISLLGCLAWSWSSWSAPLPENQVFHFSFHQVDSKVVMLDWDIKKGYFLYQDRIWIADPHHQARRIHTFQYPDPEIKISKQGQTVTIYRDKLALSVPLAAADIGQNTIRVHYQGCSDEGFCYPPQTREVPIRLLKNVSAPSAPKAVAASGDHVKAFRSSQDVKTLFLTTSPAWVMLSFLGFGLLLAFTPCVLPMVPVLSSIIIGHGTALSGRKGFLLSLTYVLSMSVTYGIIGAGIALLGANLQVLMQSPFVIATFSIIFVLLALSMFDVYQFRLPFRLQNWIASISRSHQGGHYFNAAIMGSVSILVLSPCVTPPLIAALSYIAETGSVILGLSSLFFLGFGMGLPLLLLGASAGKLLPKAGQWMHDIKYIFGTILLALAIHLSSRLLSPLVSMLLWSVLFLSSGLGLKPFFPRQTGLRPLINQVIGILLIVFGGFILYGAAAGHTNPWQPLSTPTPFKHGVSAVKVVTNLADAQAILSQAASAQRPVLLDFYATWCDSCQQIEKTVMQAPELSEWADRLIMVQIDLSRNDQDSKALLQHFQVIAPPTFIFFDKTGQVQDDLQWVGMIDLNHLLTRIQTVVAGIPN